MNLKIPNFIIIGAAKSGTTSLYKYLCRHPQIYMSSPKEPDFFSIDGNYNRGMDWYSSLFNGALPNQICGEASTTYSRYHQHPRTAERIYQTLPQTTKFIYIMRQPIDRAYSFYIYRFKGSLHKPELAVSNTFEETIKQQSEFIESSYYLQQIERYLPFFPKESFLFLLMEDLIERPAQTLSKILTFINVDDINLIEREKIVANKASDYPEWYVKKQLLAPLKTIPGINLFYSLIPKNVKNNTYQIVKKIQYKKWKNSQFMPPPMLPETRAMLVEHFKEPNLKLSQFLGRDLSHWNK